MANIAKGWAIGDTVYVHYIGSPTLQWLPQSRVVKDVKVNSSTNEATVSFTTGDAVNDGAVVQVYTTQALCAAGIITYIIAQSAAACVLDTTTSIVSTAGNASVTLGRIG